jgi:hypothetical protein
VGFPEQRSAAAGGQPLSGVSGHVPDRKQGKTWSLMCGSGCHSAGRHRQVRFEIKFQMNQIKFQMNQIKFKSFKILTDPKKTLSCLKKLK